MTSLAEVSSNIFVRSEQIIIGHTEHRHAIRKHVFEMRSGESTTAKRRIFQSDIEGVLTYFRFLHRQPGFLMGNNQKTEDLEERIEEALNRFIQGHPDNGNPGRSDRSSKVDGKSLNQFLQSGLEQNLALPTDLARRITGFLFSPLQCAVRLPVDSAKGKYLGFVDLRQHSPTWPVALACLAPPRDLRHDPQVRIIQGLYAPRFGGHGFASTVYCSHNPDSGGHACAQASIAMALAHLSDRGAKVVGGFDASTAIEDCELKNYSKTLSEGLQKIGVQKCFKHRGLYDREIVKYLNSPHKLGTTSIHYNPEVHDNLRPTLYREAARLVSAYITARCPIIALGSGRALLGGNLNNGKNPGHAVLICGIRRVKMQQVQVGGDLVQDELDVVYHDPNRGPYCMRPLTEILVACEQAYSGRKSHLNLIFVADARVKLHASQCLDWFYDNKGSYWRKFIAVPVQRPGTRPAQPNAQELTGARRENDFRINLMHKRDIPRLLGAPRFGNYELSRRNQELNNKSQESGDVFFRNSLSRYKSIKSSLKSLSGDWYWALAGYAGGENGRFLSDLWLFSCRDSVIETPTHIKLDPSLTQDS